MAKSKKIPKDSSQERRVPEKRTKGTRSATSAASGPAAGGGLAAGGGAAPAGTGAESHTTPPRAPQGGKLEEGIPETKRSVDLPPESSAAAQGVERTTGLGTPSERKEGEEEES